MKNSITIVISAFITIFLICLIFSLILVEKLHAEEAITDADIATVEYTILTGMEDGLINAVSANYHYEWSGDETDYNKQVTMTASVGNNR